VIWKEDLWVNRGAHGKLAPLAWWDWFEDEDEVVFVYHS
jgi:hypothetical protein